MFKNLLGAGDRNHPGRLGQALRLSESCHAVSQLGRITTVNQGLSWDPELQKLTQSLCLNTKRVLGTHCHLL